MRRPRKVLIAIALAGVAAGLTYLISGLVYVPDPDRFQATGELAKTEYRVGQQIAVEPFLTYMGRRSVTISSRRPLLFVEVYNAENEIILYLPQWAESIRLFHTLEPKVPYNEKDRWPSPGYLMQYTFRLEQAGSYKVVVLADFRLEEYPAPRSHVYSEPIWIEVTG